MESFSIFLFRFNGKSKFLDRLRKTHFNSSYYHTMSKAFIPLDMPKNAKIEELNPSELLTLAGCIQRSASGYFHILPTGQRVLDRLVHSVDSHFQNSLGAQKISMPSLSPHSLWRTSGRVEKMGEELMTLRDRTGKRFVLNPTHEESVTQLVGSVSPLSFDKFPLLLYQISSKFRDEPRPKHGLLRLKEFVMNDMYSFDASSDSAHQTYQNVVESYSTFFDNLGIDVVRVTGDCGVMGGSLSHEFHVLSEFGESRLLLCQHCSHPLSDQPLNDQSARLISDEKQNGDDRVCRHCRAEMMERSSIEVGHTFLLGEHYSDTFGAHYVDKTGHKRALTMGCYGLGLSRLLAASVSRSSPLKQKSSADGVLPRAGDENKRNDSVHGARIQWPSTLAPYRLCVIPSKNGSRECVEHNADNLCEQLLRHLSDVSALRGNNVLVDDRCHLSVGRRISDLALLGSPATVVFGKGLRERPQKFELIIGGATSLVSFDDLLKLIRQYFAGFDCV